VSGGASGFAFVAAAHSVAPEYNNFARYTTFGVLLVLGSLSALGPILARGDVSSSFAGVAMIVVSFASLKLFADEAQ